MQSTLKSKTLSLLCALAMCSGLACLALSKPTVKSKADVADFASVYDYDIKQFIGSGFTVSQASDTSFAIALGSQLMLWMISEQVAQERENHPGVSWNFNNFKGITGWYRLQVDIDAGISRYYPMTFMFTDTTENHAYPGMDGGLECIKCKHFACKIMPTGYPTLLQASLTSSNVQIIAGGSNATGFGLVATDFEGNFWSPNSLYANKTGWNPYIYLRFSPSNVDSAPVYNVTNSMSSWASINNANYGQQFMAVGSSPNSVVTQNLPSVDVTPENLPTIYDTYILPNYPPEYLVYPDGWPEDPTEETTEETTEAPSGTPQPFTLPPEWLEDYTFEVETLPLPIPPEATLPAVEIDENTGDSLMFWKEYWESFMEDENNQGLLPFLYIILGLSAAEFILWHIGTRIK